VVLLPEIEVPGHSAQLTERMPETFAIAQRDKNPATINMGREAAYAALDTLLGEVASVFRTTPYIHIGADEAALHALEDDPDVRRTIAQHSLGDVQELYRHFIVRMNEIVKKHGKRTLLWEGFHAEGRVDIPRDITVMAWETIYQLPQDLIAGGYRIINGSWKPLYVVNDKKWDVEYIYGWNLWRWENWVEHMPSYTPIQLEPSPAIQGASLESWHQPQHVVLPTVRRRLAAMSERTWNASLEKIEPDRPYALFARDLELTDASLQEIISPVAIDVHGLRYPELEEGHYNEEYWFGDTLTLVLAAGADRAVRYTLDGSPVQGSSPLYRAPIKLGATTTVRARAYTSAGEPVGYERWHVYELRPVDATVTGQLETPAEEVWEKMDPSFVFSTSVKVTLRALRPGTIRYTTDDVEPSVSSPAYSAPLEVDTAMIVRAQLFDASDQPVGKPWVQSFKRAR
jgi:N-acetyl-beta-hexosaminidase